MQPTLALQALVSADSSRYDEMGQIILLIFRTDREPASISSPGDFRRRNLVPFRYHLERLALELAFADWAFEHIQKIGFDLSILFFGRSASTPVAERQSNAFGVCRTPHGARQVT